MLLWVHRFLGNCRKLCPFPEILLDLRGVFGYLWLRSYNFCTLVGFVPLYPIACWLGITCLFSFKTFSCPPSIRTSWPTHLNPQLQMSMWTCVWPHALTSSNFSPANAAGFSSRKMWTSVQIRPRTYPWCDVKCWRVRWWAWTARAMESLHSGKNSGIFWCNWVRM